MNRLGAVVAFSATLAMASPALANQIQVGYAGTPNSAYGPYQSGQGGEFTLNIVGGADLNVGAYHDDVSGFGSITSFQSFCIEKNEYLYPYSATYDAVINTSAMNGGVGGGSPDPISAGTAYLYSQFAQGELAGYNFDGTEAQREASAAALQQAIWWLEDELGAVAAPSNSFLTLLTVGPTPLFTSLAAAQGNAAGQYGVVVLNLTEGGVKRQDQLYFRGISTSGDVTVPDGGTTMTLLGIGLLGLAAGRRYLHRT